MSFDIANGLEKAKSKKRRDSRKSIYDKQREEETIQNAISRGYLRRMTVEFLNDNVGLEDRDLPTIGYLNVTALQLSSLGVLEMCVNLRVCILPGNYITSFDALANCVNLWALDLHSNQIKKVPRSNFWAALKNLKVVLLHDNGISKLDTIHRLSSSPSIVILTLYDTPLSLKKNYRHHMVNGVWSLKALDHHVISDEEIIEDTKMGGQFSTMHNNFMVDVNHNLTKESTVETAIEFFEGLLSDVNKIQSKYSPVVIIQKMIRGYLVRKRFKHVMATRVWAATTIQRFYRHHKGITTPRHALMPPPSSPIRNTPDDKSLKKTSANQSNEDGSLKITSGDDDENLFGERNGSLKITSEDDDENLFGERTGKKVESTDESTDGFDESCGTKIVTRRMTVDLVKLESTAMETIQNATCNDTVSLGLEKRDKFPKDSKSTMSRLEKQKNEKNEQSEGNVKRTELEYADEFVKKRRLKPEMIGKYQTVRVFLGEVVEPGTEQEDAVSSDDEESGFQLCGVTPPQQNNEPVVEMLLSKKETGADIRRVRREKEQKSLRQPERLAKTPHKMTNNQRLFMRTHGTMGLACLRAVHQAYGDRERAREQTNKAERVAEMKERREKVASRLRIMKQEYQENVLRDRIRDGVKIADALRENERKQEQDFKKVTARRVTAVMDERARQAEKTFIKEFALQQTSISQALRSHDHAELKKQKLAKATETVRNERKKTLLQQTLVKKYLEHRQLTKQAETARAKAEIDARIQEQSKRQSSEIRTRLKQMKNSHKQVNELYPVPALNAPAADTPLAVLSPGRFAEWGEILHKDSRHYFDDSFSDSEICFQKVSHVTL